MNNSLDRLVAGIIDALRREVIPRLDDEFARGQAYAAVDLLQNLRPRLDWALAPLVTQIQAQLEAARRIAELLPQAPAPPATLQLPQGLASGSELQALRDELDVHLSELVHWLAAPAGEVAAAALAQARAALSDYMQAQVRREVSLTARPLFGEIAGNDKPVTPSQESSRC